MDGSESGTVPSGHVLVEGVHGFRPRHLTVLLVHVVSARSGVVADPDAKVLDLERTLLVDLTSHSVSIPISGMRAIGCISAGACQPYLVQRDDLAVRLLDLSQLG